MMACTLIHGATELTAAPMLNHVFPLPDEDVLQARLNILRSVREQVRDDFLIVVNVGARKIPHYADYINGGFMETGRDTPLGYSHNELKKVESTLLWSEKNLREPRTNCLQGTGIPTEPPDGPTNRRMMRVITTLSLTHSDGYVMYTTGARYCHHLPRMPLSVGSRVVRQTWHAFWDADLGHPVGPKAQHHQNTEGFSSASLPTVGLFTTAVATPKLSHSLHLPPPSLIGEITLRR